MAFRFFINVDKCLNMNNFEFFFYQKRSRYELHLLPDVYIGEGTGISFYKAAADIRMYLDRFPYNVGDYQIIIAMRSDYNRDVETFRDTLLSRLLAIDYDLRQNNILIRAGLGVEIAVNLIMLYEANVLKSIHAVDSPYMGSERLADDYHLLLKEIGVPAEKEDNFQAVREAWSNYRKEHADQFRNCRKPDDGTPANALCVFFNNLIRQYEKEQNSANAASADASALHALKEVLKGYQVFELITDKQNRNKDINTLLRVVEYATTDFDVPEGTGNLMTLTERSNAHWQQIAVEEDEVIRIKYAKMLSNYRERLSKYVAFYDGGYATSDTEFALPESVLPADDAISINDSIFESDYARRNRKINPKSLVRDFRNKLSPVNSLAGRWEDTFRQISAIFGQIGESLEEYSFLLGEKYSEQLKRRRVEERAWHRKAFVEGPATKQEIKVLSAEKDKLLAKMNQPKITPALSFQDQLNMEAALEQEDHSIRHYIRCIQSVSAKNFFLLISLLLGFVALLYGILQSYNFETMFTAMIFLGYLGICLILMLLTWGIPLAYYKRKVVRCLVRLEDDMDKYVRGYFDRADQLHEYINLLNKLDYAERHIYLKKRAVETTEWVVNARTWHYNRAKEHLKKLEFFSGLISTYKADRLSEDADHYGIENGPVVSRDHVDDVMDNSLYWPEV